MRSPVTGINGATLDGEELLALARLDIEANRLDAALLKVKEALNHSDFPLDLYAVAAKLYAQIGLFDKAKALYRRYLQEDPESLTEHFQLGMVEYDSGNQAVALEIWQDVLDRLPTHPPTLFYSSVALVENGDLESARRNLDILFKSASMDNLYFERGKVLLATISEEQQKRSPAAVETES